MAISIDIINCSMISTYSKHTKKKKKKQLFPPKVNIKQQSKRNPKSKTPKTRYPISQIDGDYLRSKEKRRPRPPRALRRGVPHRIQRRGSCPAIWNPQETRIHVGSSRNFDPIISFLPPIRIPHWKPKKKKKFPFFSQICRLHEQEKKKTETWKDRGFRKCHSGSGYLRRLPPGS